MSKSPITISFPEKEWNELFEKILSGNHPESEGYNEIFLLIQTIKEYNRHVTYSLELSFSRNTLGIYGQIITRIQSIPHIGDANFVMEKCGNFFRQKSQEPKTTSTGAQTEWSFHHGNHPLQSFGITKFLISKDYESKQSDASQFQSILESITSFLCFEIGNCKHPQIIAIGSPKEQVKKGSSQKDLPDWLRDDQQKTKLIPKVDPERTSEILNIVNGKETHSLLLSDMGGNRAIKTEIQKLVSLFKNREHFKKWNIQPPRGVILYGPPGTGKTLSAKIISNEIGIPFYTLSPSDIFSKWVGESAQNLERFFAELVTPCVVFIDEIDSFTSKRENNEDGSGGQEIIRTMNVLLQQMDGFIEKPDILFIGATNRISSIDPAFLRAGRFDHKIFLDYPDFEARREIWNIYLKKSSDKSEMKYFDENVDIDLLSKNSDRFTGADIAEVINRMLKDYAMGSLMSKKVQHIINGETTLRGLLYIIEQYKNEKILNREIVPTKSKITLNEVCVTSEIKEEMQKLIKQYKNKDLFEAIGVNLPRGILLYGPPGTGKTLLAKALAHEIGVIFYSFQPKDIFSSWMNESIEKIDEIFSSLETPCIIFIDEIEVILKKRSDHSHGNNEDAKIVNAFLQIMDGFETKRDILFIGATNRLDMIDDAVLRAGRFDAKFAIELPDEIIRSNIFRLYIQAANKSSKIAQLFEDTIDYTILANKTEGYSGADIAEIIRRTKQTFIMGEIEEMSTGNTDIHFTKKISEKDIIKQIKKYKDEVVKTSPEKKKIGFGTD